MARSNRMSVQKRLRERKKAEQAELKRVTSRRSGGAPADADRVAKRSDLEAYGVLPTFDDAAE